MLFTKRLEGLQCNITLSQPSQHADCVTIILPPVTGMNWKPQQTFLLRAPSCWQSLPPILHHQPVSETRSPCTASEQITLPCFTSRSLPLQAPQFKSWLLLFLMSHINSSANLLGFWFKCDYSQHFPWVGYLPLELRFNSLPSCLKLPPFDTHSLSYPEKRVVHMPLSVCISPPLMSHFSDFPSPED